MNIPTKITVARIAAVGLLLVGLFICDLIPNFSPLMLGEGVNLAYLTAVIVFALASATDAIDGRLARRWHQVTDLGKFLDPVADKLLVDSLLIYLAVAHFGLSTLTLPLFCVILMILRDLVVDGIRVLAASKGVILAANSFGKLKTALQMAAIPLVLLNGWPFSYFDLSWNPAYRIATLVVYLATLASLFSGVVYVIQNRGVFKEGPAA
jgi:CDP-diacylglycerol--glycerol-3-phosphate 3-phosphatidyltransferase